MNHYKTLVERIRQNKGIQKVYIIPIVVTISGFISNQSIERLKTFKINIKWPPIIREIIINQIKDIMFFLNQHIDGIELEPGNSSSNNQSETPNLEDVPKVS